MKNNWCAELFLIIVLGAIVKVEAQSSTLAIADSLYNLGNYSNAIRAYQKVIPKNQYVLLQIAKSHKAKGTLNQAIKYYEEIIKKHPITPTTQLEYAKLLTTTRKFKRADSIYSRLVLEYPKNPNFQYKLGIVKQQLRDTTAILYFKEAFALDNTHQKSCFEITKYYLKKRNYDKVVETANLGLKSYPENAELIGVLGQNFLLREDYYTALPYFEKLISLNQENEYIYSKLGLCYYQTHAFQKAIIHLEKVLAYNTKVPERYTMLAYAYQKLEKFDKALENYKIALELKDLPIENELMSIALAYRFQENWNKAIEYVQLAIKENPNDDRAHYQMAMFADAHYKDPEIKLKYYHNYLTKFGQNKRNKYFVSIIEKRIVQLEKEIESK